MNNMTNIMTSNQFQMCQFDQLLNEIGGAKSMGTEQDYVQIISLFAATFIGLISMGYGLLTSFFNRGLTLHFVGIRRPNSFSKSQYKLFDNIDTETTMITIKSSLKETDTISTLKELIKKTYKIRDKNDILILYSHHIISEYKENEQLKLQDFNIRNNALLTLAVCDSDKINQYGEYEGIQRDIITPKRETETPANSINEMFEMFQDEEDDEDDDEKKIVKEEEKSGLLVPFKGFDIITQECGVLVYKMPICGHEMNKESLYEYSLSIFNDHNNIKLKCPHRSRKNTGKCEAEWDYNAIIDILKHEENDKDSKEWIDFAKLELLSSRNKVENECNVQKCPRCKTLYFKNNNADKMKLADIKTIEDIEKEFKTECVFCKPMIPKIEENKLEKSEEEEIDTTEAQAINAMFGMFQDDEEEEEIIDTTEARAINAMFDMFQDEEDEEDDVKKPLILEPTNSFCFCCGKEWIVGHICDNSFRRELCEILAKAEVQKIGSVEGVPSIRCCPKCCQLLYHIDCCKHMKCKGCATRFCHVCLKPQIDGKWQCGGNSTVCPCAPRQNMQTLPDNIIITKQKFKLFDDQQK